MKGTSHLDYAGIKKDHKLKSSSTVSKPMILISTAFVIILWLSSASSSKSEDPTVGKEKANKAKAAFELTCSGFANETIIPMKYARDGDNLSPPLSWSGIPDGTQSFAMIMDDPDAPTPKPWVHWIIYNIPSTQTSLTEGLKADGTMKEGQNSWSLSKYDGPQPPKGQIHLYIFKLYALDTLLFSGDTSSAGKTKEQLEQAFSGHVLAEARWTGKFSR
ncbi:unnamed protein product [Cylindrotheca closterium]|uniref:YbhB/YbcL family Raf kinase inhibitor-like protein n=1 Tax=Cylindrotheca closterium TaxID=2856 RepID=A0AAD2G3B3_9STRA|nr:unnamed protein product [Cylindrotheca closterium]